MERAPPIVPALAELPLEFIDYRQARLNQGNFCDKTEQYVPSSDGSGGRSSAGPFCGGAELRS